MYLLYLFTYLFSAFIPSPINFLLHLSIKSSILGGAAVAGVGFLGSEATVKSTCGRNDADLRELPDVVVVRTDGVGGIS